MVSQPLTNSRCYSTQESFTTALIQLVWRHVAQAEVVVRLFLAIRVPANVQAKRRVVFQKLCDFSQPAPIGLIASMSVSKYKP